MGMAAVVGWVWIMSLVFLWLSYLLHDVQSQISVIADINNFEDMNVCEGHRESV